MCGIAGIIVTHPPPSREYKPALLRSIKKMTNALAHRGPDGEGHWMNEAGTVCFGHNRLAIIDLSAAASQPMHYTAIAAIEEEINRYTITYNGEIYNYIEIREELQKSGYHFHSQSDTEVILAAYDYWKEECLQQFDGMFAFAIWDAKEQVLFAARDRFGEKPFYFYKDELQLVFASEMKALWAMGVPKIADNKMLVNYLALGYVQNANDKEQTFFENISSLPPAHFFQLHLPGNKLQLHNYWKLDKDNTIKISPADAIEKFRGLLTDSVSRRLRSDVAVGSSLSGGLDSSAIAALIHLHLKKNATQQTFSAVFPGFEKDESNYIKSLCQSIKINNFNTQPTVQGLLQDFLKLCHHQEEPFPSASIYAQFKVFELAKQHQVPVLLDGQGADETLAGYFKYIHWYIQQLVQRKRYTAAMNEKRIFRKNNIPFKWGIVNYLATYLPAHAAIHLEHQEYNKILHHPDLNKDFVRTLHGREWEGIHKPIITKLNDILFYNTAVLGLEELLRYADRNSMAHGREVRLPFLSHYLAEFVFSLPANFKIHEGWTKWLLRNAMDKKIPNSIVWRKDKIGFEPPQKQWMENKALQDLMQDAKKKLAGSGILNKQTLTKKIEPLSAHHANNFDWRYLCAAQML